MIECACTCRTPAVLYTDRKHDGKRRCLGETKDRDALGAGGREDTAVYY